jgi:hypothetical protein
MEKRTRRIKVLSLYQPWATLWVLQIKKYETRHWGTFWRGPLLIHSALNQEDLRFAVVSPYKELLEGRPLPRGVVLGACILADTPRILSYVPARMTELERKNEEVFMEVIGTGKGKR